MTGATTRLGVLRDRYAEKVEPRPSRFFDRIAYLEWCVRADRWDADTTGGTTPEHEKTDPPINRFGEALNDDYLSPACALGMGGDCISSACCCFCHVPASIHSVPTKEET